MDGKGRALDNIITERFWRTVKYDEVYLKDYESMIEARDSLGSSSISTTLRGLTRPAPGIRH